MSGEYASDKGDLTLRRLPT